MKDYKKKSWKLNIFIPLGIFIICFSILAFSEIDYSASGPSPIILLASLLNVISIIWLIILGVHYIFKIPFFSKIVDGLFGIFAKIIFGVVIFYLFLMFLSIFSPGFMMGPFRFGV